MTLVFIYFHQIKLALSIAILNLGYFSENLLFFLFPNIHKVFVKDQMYGLATNKIKTYSIANGSADELEKRCENQIRSRMRELFNLISFDKNCRDKRV